MKISILTSEFIAAIKNLEKVKVNNVLPILDSIEVTANSSNAVLTRTNLGKTIKSTIPACDIGGLGTVIIPMKTIDLIKNLKDESFTLTGDSIITDKKTISFKSGELSEYPTINMAINESFFEVTESELHRMLEVKYCMATDENRPILCGVCFNGNNTVSIDGYRLSLRQGSYNSDLKMVVVDAETIDLLSKIINKKSNAIVKIYGQRFDNKDKQFIKFEFINNNGYTTEVIGQTIAGEYLNYKNIIPTDFETTITVKAEDVSNEIEFINKVSNKETHDYIKLIASDKELITDCRITESIYDKEASRTATEKAQKESKKQKPIKEIKKYSQVETNRITSKVDVDTKGNKWEASFNGQYLYEGFKLYNDTHIQIKAISHFSPMIITADDCNMEMILPVRCNN